MIGLSLLNVIINLKFGFLILLFVKAEH